MFDAGSGAEYQAVLRTMADAAVVSDSHGRIRSVNAAAERMFGWSAAELAGADLAVLMPANFASAHDGFLDAYRRTGVRHIIGIGREVAALRRDGTIFPMELAVSEVPPSTPGGEVRFLGVIRDISGRKEAEAALIAAKSQAEASARAKSGFLANLSHELRTPLHLIIGFAQLLQSAATAPDDVAGHACEIESAGRQLLTVFDDLLGMAALDGGAQELTETRLQPASLVHEAVEMVSDQAQRAGLQLRVDAQLQRLHLMADRHALLRVLTNLLSNAIKFTPRGGTVRVQAGVQSTGEYGFLVEDTGVGMDSDLQAALAAPFVRGEPYRTAKTPGLGLGLSSARMLTELHGGRMVLQSEPGRGTRVGVLLPAARIRDGARVAA
jgi:PAS domain S-box-containing protein